MVHLRSFAKPCADVLSGKINLDVFFLKTDRVWKVQAKSLCRRWKSSLVREEDTFQNLRLAVCQLVIAGKYDPAKSHPADYLVFNAVDKAKKRIHKGRSAKLSGNADSNQSREILPVENETLDQGQFTEGTAEVEYPSEMRKVLDLCENEFQRLSFLTLCETGDFAEVVKVLLSKSGEFRAQHRISGQEETLKKVKRELLKLAS